jgi:hypothetical protein
VEIKRLLQRCFIATVLLGAPGGAVAQEATLTGTISDSTGAVLPGVTVTAVHESSGIVFESVTDGRGVFRVPVRIGNYRVTATLTGFADATRTGVPVSVGQTVTLNLQMAPSGLQESVTVTGEAPLIDVTTSSLGSNISQAQMEELPLNGRNWQDLAMLAVGNKVNEVGTSQGLALISHWLPRPWLVDCTCLARSARLGPLCGAATSTKFAFGTA